MKCIRISTGFMSQLIIIIIIIMNVCTAQLL